MFGVVSEGEEGVERVDIDLMKGKGKRCLNEDRVSAWGHRRFSRGDSRRAAIICFYRAAYYNRRRMQCI